MCFICFSEQNSDCFPTWLVSVTEMEYVYSAVQTEYLNTN
jgi:hypothetical protein